jgi:hypothetical protein
MTTTKCNSDRTRVDTVCILIISFPDLCDNLHTGKIHCCGPVRHIINMKITGSLWKETQTETG